MTEFEISEERPVVAYALDLFGAPPKPVRAYRPAFFAWHFCGVPVLPDETGLRQYVRMRADTCRIIELPSTAHPEGTADE